MIDTATNWFYGERRLSAGAAIENLRHDLWAYGYYNAWLRLVKNEPPYAREWSVQRREVRVGVRAAPIRDPARRQRERVRC